MHPLFWLMGGVVTGGATSRVLGAPGARRRRAAIRDKAISAAHVMGDAVDVTSRDLSNRTRGVVAELRSRLTRGRAPASARGGGRFELLQVRWSPTARLATGVAGGVMVLAGMRRAGAVGAVSSAAGLVVLARAITNLPLRRLFGVGAGRGAVTVQKTITVAAPIEEVFGLWSRYEDFPRFMSHVREIRRSADGRARWTVAGPAGVPMEWETEETEHRAPERLGWRTAPGAPVAHAGTVRFEAVPGGTRVHLRMDYDPPAGALGHGLAALLGADPKRMLDEDLVRFKSLLEEGKTSVRGHTVTRPETGAWPTPPPTS